MDTDVRTHCAVEEQRERWDRKRRRTARELLQTERQYVEDLELTTKLYHEVFRVRCGHLKIAERGICGAIPDILVTNRELLSALDLGHFGSGFERFSETLALYKQHADSMESTLISIQYHMKKTKSFARFRKLQESRLELKGRTLEQLLDLPLCRVSQYKHYLRDLAENSHPAGSEFTKLTRSLEAMCDVCQYIEGISQKRENDRQLQRVQKLLKGRRVRIIVPGRQYIREGWLSLVPQSGEEVKQRMLFLFSDVLAVTVPCHPLHPVNAHKFACRALYPLRECQVERVLGHTHSQGGLISLSFDKEKLLLMSADQKDINNWYECLAAAVRQHHSKSVGHPINTNKENNFTASKALEEKKCPPIRVGVNKRRLDDRPMEICQRMPLVPSVSEEETQPKRPKVENERSTTTSQPAGPTEQNTGWNCLIL